ncbi:MAG: hypothetical protein RL531_1483 [Actinomycetota bacterium]|jgi:hypothetical protein
MRIRRTVAGTLAGALTLAGLALGAGPATAGAPSPATPYPQAGMTDRGACFGLAVGLARNDAGTAGLTITNQSVSIAVKGVPSSSAQAAEGAVGSCLLSENLGVTSTAPEVLKFSAKIASPSVDCALNDEDPAERPWIGKVMWSLDGNDDGVVDAKILGYVRIVGTDTETNEFAWVTGIVTKGDAAGATIGGNVFFAPVFKYNYAAGYYEDADRGTWTQQTPLGPDPAFTIAPKYGYSDLYAYYYGNCGGFGEILGTPNVRDLAFGAGLASPLGNVSAGWHFLI